MPAQSIRSTKPKLKKIRTLNVAVGADLYARANGIRARNSLTWSHIIFQALTDWVSEGAAKRNYEVFYEDERHTVGGFK